MDDEPLRLHGGRLIARRLKAHGVTHLFTLSGGHLFSIYEGCRHEGIEIVDTRHEQAATFAAEGWAKATRTPGVAAVTAGPGVTNALSALGSAQSNNSPMVVLGGERGRRLVAGVDDLDALVAAALVDREQVAAGEREEVADAARLQRLGDDSPTVSLHGRSL